MGVVRVRKSLKEINYKPVKTPRTKSFKILARILYIFDYLKYKWFLVIFFFFYIFSLCNSENIFIWGSFTRGSMGQFFDPIWPDSLGQFFVIIWANRVFLIVKITFCVPWLSSLCPVLVYDRISILKRPFNIFTVL